MKKGKRKAADPSQVLSVRLSVELAARVKAAAARRGLTVSAWVAKAVSRVVSFDVMAGPQEIVRMRTAKTRPAVTDQVAAVQPRAIPAGPVVSPPGPKPGKPVYLMDDWEPCPCGSGKKWGKCGKQNKCQRGTGIDRR